jgi:ABC-type methionine transport system permease subunit
MQKNESKDRKANPCLFMVSLSFLVSPALSSPLLLLAFLNSQQRKDEGKKTPSVLCVFFTPCLSCVFLIFLLLSLSFAVPPFSFSVFFLPLF